MKLFFATFLLLSSVTVWGQTPPPAPAPINVTIKSSLEKIRAQLIVEATEKRYDLKENTDKKLVVQGKSEKRAEFKYGLVFTRIGSIPDERITYQFKQQDDTVMVEAVTEVVDGEATGKYPKGEKKLKKQLAALKKQLEK